MLQDRDGRLFKFGNQIRRRADVENVVEGERLPLKFFEIFLKVAVESSVLVWIFAVAQSQRQGKRK